MKSPEYISYQASVEWLRAQSEYAELVEFSYLDADNLAAAKRFARSEEFAQIAQWAGLHDAKLRPRHVLDVGCGNGIASYAMGMLGHYVTALDPDESADVGLEATRRLVPLVGAANGKIECVRGFVENLEFSDASFDVVYARQALHHFSDLEKGLRECVRVLKPGGVLIATREHVVNNESQLQEFLASHPLHHKHGGENAYPLPCYISAIEATGLPTVEVFAPWDTVVNHFPETNAGVRRMIAEGIRKRVKVPIGYAALQIPGFERRMRRKLSSWSSHPGRMFSFVARKPT